jgi:hypothetical protein
MSDNRVPTELSEQERVADAMMTRGQAEHAERRAEIARLRGVVARILGPQLRVIARDPLDPQS